MELNPNAWLKRKKKSLCLRAAHQLLAMAASNDPFNKGTAGDFEKAKWFARVYEEFGYPGIHLRRLHYRMVHSDETLTLWDGVTEYLNIERHWEKLQEASIAARILRKVDANDFTEKRNKARPTLLQGVSGVPEVGYWAEAPTYGDALPLAEDATDLPRILGFSEFASPTYGVHGYDYSPELQPNVVEIWSEAEDATLHSLASRYGINYVPGLGFASLTAIKTMLGRLEASDKPGRILYVSDFDPAGQAMPISVARHCQFACWELELLAGEYAPSIKVDNVAVTREQVEQLDIPRIPIKESDFRKARFELTYGEGAVEVEALEAIRPGALERILEERIEDLLDTDLERKVTVAGLEARQVVSGEIKQIQEEHDAELEDIARRARDIEERYGRLYSALGEQVAQRYQRLANRFARHMAPLEEQLERIEGEERQAIEGLDIDLPEIPEGDSNEDEEREWLYDSERDFLEQTERFRKAQGKD
jgi:hypothetical protein